MLIQCPILTQLCLSIERWIIEFGFEKFVLSNRLIILGDNENPLGISSIIVLTK